MHGTNRLKKIKKSLDKQQVLNNDLANIKKEMSKPEKVVKRCSSRTGRRNTLLSNQGIKNRNQVQAKLGGTRSRSKTDFEPMKSKVLKHKTKKAIQKTNIYTLNHKNNELLSRNNSKEPKDMRTKSFLKPTFSSNATYKTNYSKTGKETFSTYINSKTIAGEKSIEKKEKERPQTQKQQKYAYVTKKGESKSKYNTRNNTLQSKTNKNYYGLTRFGSISYNSSVSSAREVMTSKRGNRKNNKSVKGEESHDDKPAYSTFLKDRKSLGENKCTFHQNSHSTLPH